MPDDDSDDEAPCSDAYCAHWGSAYECDRACANCRHECWVHPSGRACIHKECDCDEFAETET